MSLPRYRGFTLVEILIVVIILGILAALTVPGFTNAANESTRSALARQLQTINHQIELYRASNASQLPTEDATDPLVEGGNNGGWGILVSENYLTEPPFNMFTRSMLLVAGDEATAIAATSDAGLGWYYAVEDEQLNVWAAGFDETNNTLSSE